MMILSVVLTMLLASLKGVVFGESNDPIPDAYVSVLGSGKGAFTDSGGNYKINFSDKSNNIKNESK